MKPSGFQGELIRLLTESGTFKKYHVGMLPGDQERVIIRIDDEEYTVMNDDDGDLIVIASSDPTNGLCCEDKYEAIGQVIGCHLRNLHRPKIALVN